MKPKTSLTLLLAASMLCGCAAAPNTAGSLSKQEIAVVTKAFGRTPTRYELTVVTTVINAAKRNIAVVESATGRQLKDWTEADTKLWQELNSRAFLQATAGEQEKAETRRRIGAAIAEGLQTAGRSIQEGAQQRAASQQQELQRPLWDMPREYVRRNAITGQLETVTDYGNGIQNVWPVGQ